MSRVTQLGLYNHGMAFITRNAELEKGSKADSLALQFKEREMNDVLKSLIIENRGKGRVAGLSYQTAEDLDKQIKEKALVVDKDGSVLDMLSKVTGSQVELRVGDGKVSANIFGRVVGIQRSVNPGQKQQVLLLTADNEIRFVDLDQVQDVRLEDLTAYSDLEFYLDALVSQGKKSMKGVTLFLDGKGQKLDISYISQMAPWRMSYRLFYTPEGAKLQCWGIVDNTLDEDLKDIDLTLISGKPISFIYDLYLAQMIKRQYIREEMQITTAPVELEGEKRKLDKGDLELEEMREKAAELQMAQAAPAAKPCAAPPCPEPMMDIMMDGDFGSGGPMAEMAKMKKTAGGMELRSRRDKEMMSAMDGMKMECEPCEAEEYYDDMEMEDEPGGMILEFEQGLEAVEPERVPTAVKDYGEGAVSTVVAAEAVKLPEFFQYEITAPVTIKRGQSAMVPIMQESVACTKEMIYNRVKTGKHPLVVMRIENKLALRFERGPITILEGADYAGEGILPALNPDAEVRIAYAVATGVRIREENEAKREFSQVELSGDKVIYKENHDEVFGYVIENDSLETAPVVIEHPKSDTHKLLEMEDPFEVTEEFFKWKVTVKPKKEVTFTVKQREVLKDEFPILSRSLSTYKDWLKEKKIDRVQMERIEEAFRINDRISSMQHDLDVLSGQEGNMVNHLGILNRLTSNLGFEPGEMNLRNRLVEKYFEVEYRLALLREVMLALRRDLKHLRTAQERFYWPEKHPDLEDRKIEEIPLMKRLLREQTVQYWYGQSSEAVRLATTMELG